MRTETWVHSRSDDDEFEGEWVTQIRTEVTRAPEEGAIRAWPLPPGVNAKTITGFLAELLPRAIQAFDDDRWVRLHNIIDNTRATWVLDILDGPIPERAANDENDPDWMNTEAPTT